MCTRGIPKLLDRGWGRCQSSFQEKDQKILEGYPTVGCGRHLVQTHGLTAYGRSHSAATRTLHYAAGLAASRSDQGAEGKALLARWHHEIQVAIECRAAAMARAVLPKRHAGELWLFTGHAGRGALQRAPCPLEVGIVVRFLQLLRLPGRFQLCSQNRNRLGQARSFPGPPSATLL